MKVMLARKLVRESMLQGRPTRRPSVGLTRELQTPHKEVAHYCSE